MGWSERSIKIAVDSDTGKNLEADILFDKKKDAFQIRKKYQEGNLLLTCCECGQDLFVSGSKYDRLHFKHKPGHGYCILSDVKLSPKEHQKVIQVLNNKESFRHIQLKNKIGTLLNSVDGVEVTSIAIDNKFIIRGNEKRKPDVFCRYKGKELVFEIQLSDLPLSYILSRYQFYKKNGIYLIWILDNFDIHNQGTLERDIKYLTKYENFFKLDERSDSFHLFCEYKFPFLTDEFELHSKWLQRSVSLDEIKFDNDDYQVYYFNYGDNQKRIAVEQQHQIKIIKEAEAEKRRVEKLSAAKSKATSIIKQIKEIRERKALNYKQVEMELFALNNYETKIFNDTLNLKSKKKPLHRWVQNSEKDDTPFLNFIFECPEIEIDVNEKDENGITIFQEIYKNDGIFKNSITRSLFKKGYVMNQEDVLFYKNLNQIENKKKKKNLVLFELYNKLQDRTLVDSIFNHAELLYTIESARQNKVVGYNRKPNDIVWLANNAIQNHKEYWEYIELAFKSYKLWERLTELDKKGTFAQKLEDFYNQLPKQKYDFDEVFRDLYSELLTA